MQLNKIDSEIVNLYNLGLSYAKIATLISDEGVVAINRAYVGHRIAKLRNDGFDGFTRKKNENKAKNSKSIKTKKDKDNSNDNTVDAKEVISSLVNEFKNISSGKRSYQKDLPKKEIPTSNDTEDETSIPLDPKFKPHDMKPEELAKAFSKSNGIKKEKDSLNGINNFKKSVSNNGTEKLETTLEILNKEQAKDDSYILKAFGYDPKKWRIKNNRSNFYQMQGKDGAEPKTLWQVKIDVQPISNAISTDDLASLFNTVEPKVFSTGNTNVTVTDRNLVISFADLHFGITTLEEVEPLLKDIINILNKKNYKRIVIEQLGDLFHSDSFTTIETGHGTLLTTDGKGVSMEKAVQDALSFYETIINSCLENTSDVTIYHTQGNHSPSLEYMFLVALEQRYPQLSIHKNISYRTAYKLDNVGIMIAHGDTAKRKLPMLFANEYCDIWGTTKYREIHTGHYHFETVKDDLGVVQRQLGTPKPSDGYEQKNGFTMSHKKLQVFEYSPDNLRVVYNLGI